MTILNTIWLAIFIPYIAGTSLFLIMDNRKPQTTFAWLFLFIVLPVGGVILYIFFGRNWKAFAKQRKLTMQAIGKDLMRNLSPEFPRQAEVIDRLAHERTASYRTRLLELATRNSGSGIAGYNQVKILQDAHEKYPRLLEDLRGAQCSIHLQYYIWTEDEFTLQVKKVLMERARAGVKVHCLYDASNKGLSKQYLADLRAAGVAIHPYLRYDSLYTLHNANYRSHRKIAVIDGKIGYVGGMNLDQEQLSGGKVFNAWRDTHLRIHGEAATLLQALFVTSWYNTTREKLFAPAYFPPVRDEVDTFLPIQITASGPDSQWQAIKQIYFFMIASAQHHVYIQSPFFIPDESIADALRAAALAGVDVKIICQPRGFTYDLAYRAAYTYYAEMARAGCRIFLYQAGYFHPKTISIDSTICAVGTANMDIRSFSINYETIAVMYDEATALELEADFHNDLQRCEEFKLEDYKKSGVVRRFWDSVDRLFSPVL